MLLETSKVDLITTVYLLRHGHSLGNLTKTFLGHTDLDLSELGYKQAKCTSEALSNVKFDKIYSSDLLRAYNTAEFVAESTQIPIITSKNLREVYAGDWEGKKVDEIIDKWGREVFYDRWVNDFGNFILPGGESIKAAGERIFAEIKQICIENPGKTILISTHAAVLRSFWAKINHISLDDICSKLPFATNASYSIVKFINGEFVPIYYSIDDHLKEIGITKVNLV